MGYKNNKTVAAAFLVAALSVLVYLNIVYNGFVYDDHFVITQNRWIEDFGSIWQIILSSEWSFMPGSPTVNYYRPTFHILNMFSYHLFGKEAWGFHLSSILMHTANSVLLLLVARRLLAGWSVAVLLSGLFFAAHPVHAESVAWLSAESDLIYSLFVLAGLYAYMGRPGPALDNAESGPLPPAARMTPVVLSAVAFFFGLLSKETAVVLPVLAAVYDLLVRREPLLPVLPWVKRFLPFVVVFALYMALRLYALGGFAPETVKYNDITPYQGLINIFLLVPLYIGKLFWPVVLNISHHIIPLVSLAEPRAVAAIIAIICIVAFIIWLIKRNRLIAFLCIWVLVPLFPALYIPALGRELFAERYLYLPSAGFVIAAAIVIERLMKKGHARWQAASMAVLAAVVVVGYSAVTFSRTFDWRSDYTIWTDAVEKSPGSGYPWLSLASASAAAGEYAKAAAEYETAITLGLVTEDLWMAEFNRGRTYSELGRHDDSITAYRNALAIHPDNYGSHFNLGRVYARLGQYDNAETEFRTAVQIKPESVDALYNHASTLVRLGRTGEAVAVYRKAVALAPERADVRNNLGGLYAMLGDYESAEKEFRAALASDPENRNARTNLERVLKLMSGGQGM